MYKILLFLVIFAFITTVDATEINVISKFRYLLEITALKNKLKFYLHTVAVHNPYLYVYWSLTWPSKPLQDRGQEMKILT